MSFEARDTVKEAANRDEELLASYEPMTFARLMNPVWQKETLRRVDELLEQISAQGVKELVFLDKSARPISWLLHERLKYKHPDIPAPKMKFIDLGNMEADRKLTMINEMEKEHEDIYSKLDEKGKKQNEAEDREGFLWKMDCFAEGGEVEGEIWASLKYVDKIWQKMVKERADFVERIRERYGKMDGKVLIIDEMLFSGSTLLAAVAFFSEAYPESQIFGVHFCDQKHKTPFVQIPWFKQARMIGVQEKAGEVTTRRFKSANPAEPDVSRGVRSILRKLAHKDI